MHILIFLTFSGLKATVYYTNYHFPFKPNYAQEYIGLLSLPFDVQILLFVKVLTPMPSFTLHKEEWNARVLGWEGEPEHFVLRYWLSLRSAAIQSCLQLNGVQWFMWNKSSLSRVRSTKPISRAAKKQYEEKRIQKPIPEQTCPEMSLAGSPCPEQQ